VEEVPGAVAAAAPQGAGDVVAVEVLSGVRLPVSEQGYVVSISRSGWGRLHLLHACPRVPGFERHLRVPGDRRAYGGSLRRLLPPLLAGARPDAPRPGRAEEEVEECSSPTTTTEDEVPTER